MSTTYKKIGGIKTRVNIEGEGTPILILHGWGSSLASWKKVQKELANNGHKVYCPDLPGFGKSEKLSEAWNLDDYCKWVIDFCKFYNLNDLIIIGHSFGGRLTIKINQAGFKERIKKNILVAPAGIKVELNIKQKMLSFFSSIGNFIFSLPLLRLFKEKGRKLFYLLLPQMDYTKASPIMRETMQKTIQEDLTSLLSNIKKETILIWGEKDKMVPAKISKIFEDKIKKTKTIIIPKVGHSPHLKVPKKLSQIIINNL